MDKKNELLKIQGVKKENWFFFLDLTWFLPISILIRLDKYRYIQMPEDENTDMNEEELDAFFSFERADFDRPHNRYFNLTLATYSSHYNIHKALGRTY